MRSLYATGLAADVSRLYVGALFGVQVHVYERGPGGELTESEPIEVGSGVDNLLWGDDGLLYAAAHPSLASVTLHVAGWSERAPSEAWALDVTAGTARRIHFSEGDAARAASTAVVWRDVLYLGQLAAPGIVACGRGTVYAPSERSN